MDASYSTANISLSTFPEELLVEILLNLPVPDLVSCRRVNRHLNAIVDTSQRLQHHIDTVVAGVLDNPNAPLSLLERRNALARRQEAWDSLKPQWKTSTTRKFGDEFSSPDETWLPLEPLREGYHTIENLAACPNNDGLVAVGVRCGGARPPGGYIGIHSLEVDIFRLSEGGGERLWNRHCTIQVKDVVKEDEVLWQMDIEIHMNFLAVLLKPQTALMGFWQRELCVFDWETGEEVASLMGQRMHAFRFLSNSIMVVASVSPSESTATLELFSIPVTKGCTTLEKIAALGLPFVDPGCRITHIEFAPPHVKNLRMSQYRGDGLFYNASINVKPFISPISDNIVLATLNIRYSNGNDSISFAVHPSTLLRHALPSRPYGHAEALVSWESWGPAVTRWHDGGIIPGFWGGSIICGDRCLVPPSSNRLSWGPREPRDWPRHFNQARELWDFNPYRVRRLREQGPSIETETAYMTVETEPSCTRSRGIKEGVYSSLPFVKLVPKKWPGIASCMSLYEDRVVIRETDLKRKKYEIQQLYFG